MVHWPKGIKAKGDMRTQYAHAIDMVPTVLEALGIEAADARSTASHSRRSKASVSPTPLTTPRRPAKHVTQYFEMFGHRSLYHDGWRAVCPWPGPRSRKRACPSARR